MTLFKEKYTAVNGTFLAKTYTANYYNFQFLSKYISGERPEIEGNANCFCGSTFCSLHDISTVQTALSKQ